ncbi:MAG TPA: hypothetical protein VMG38_09785 [Trebonia sp.]|nr:hypothetical protein [Trebonia sp.]
MSRTQRAIRPLILGAIVVAIGTACSMLSPPTAPKGLQQQISQGAKADAKGRSQDARAPAGAITANRAKATPVVSGKDITAIGDSVMLASSMSLQQAFPGIYVDAAVSRHAFVGLDILRRLAASGQLRPVVVVALGTNGGVTTDQVHQLMGIVGPKREVVLVNTFVPLSYEQSTNSALAAAARAYPNVVLANWNKTISDRTSLLWPDEIHPHYPAGTRVYAAMVKAAVEQAVAAGSTAGPRR